MTAAAMLVALAVDALLGWPEALYRRIGHPVTWMGRMIDTLDRRWNRESDGPEARRSAGMLAALAVIGASAGVALVPALLLPGGWTGAVLSGILAWPLLAARSLHTHVRAVADPLEAGDLAMAREKVAMIVGRDPQRLDRAGVARAAIESLAENASDGVVAPLFWGVLLGLPGIAAYKAINTLDSMIGYRSPRYADFGRFAARLDDAANWIPARLTALGFALASGRAKPVWAVVLRDAGLHRSPNAGWPEAAMAAGIGCRLSGPRAYGGGLEQHPWVNAGAQDPDAGTVALGLALYRRMLMLVVAAMLVVAVF